MSETSLQKEILLVASKLGHRLFRCNTGMAWAGKLVRPTKPMMVQIFPGDVIIRSAYPIHFGLTEGGSDLIGWSDKGKFMGFETKIPGHNTDKERLEKQFKFIDAIRLSGGISGMVESKEEFINILDNNT